MDTHIHDIYGAFQRDLLVVLQEAIVEHLVLFVYVPLEFPIE